MLTIKQKITVMIQNYVQAYQKNPEIMGVWGEPLVGFADAKHPDIYKLREIVSAEHVLPEEIIKNPTIVIAYFVPFSKELAETNKDDEALASPEWAHAYEELNAMFAKLNSYLLAELTKMGYEAGISPASTTFDREKLVSNWSQRHLARLAGLGSFGMNNMLITAKGCCGRYSTVVTNLPVKPDQPLADEYCLYKSKGTCGVCVKRCHASALTLTGYDRRKCFQVCQENAKVHNSFGSSYEEKNGQRANSNSAGSSVCGKCMTNVPCSFL